MGDGRLRLDQHVTLPSTSRPASLVVADFGCGDCRLASSVRNPVHCFDLASLDPRVTVCDMAQVSTSMYLACAFSSSLSFLPPCLPILLSSSGTSAEFPLAVLCAPSNVRLHQVPLEDESVDVAVFCLSLMGTNIRDFLEEANRVLKLG